MSQITIQNLHFTYDGDHTPVFEGLELQLDTNWKLGLVGRNGRGKTTLLRLLAGELDGRGTVSLRQSCLRWPKPVADPDRQTLDILLEGVTPEDEWKIYRELSLLGLSEEILDRPFSTLSGGEQTHDRAFLDGCVDHILALNPTGPELVRGTFSSWFKDKEDRDRGEAARNEKLRGEIRRLEQAAKRTSGWSDRVEQTKYGSKNSGLRPDRGFIGHKAAKMMQRAKNIEDRQQRAIEEKSALLKDIERADSLKLTPLAHHSGRLLEGRDLAVAYPGMDARPVRFTLNQGERLCLDGGNGSGKTSLLRLVLGEEVPHTGTLFRASGLKISYVPQRADHLEGNPVAWAEGQRIDLTQFLTILRKLDFSRELFSRNMSEYSAGQQKKVLLAASLCQSAHLYLWDEPLNYIDLFSRMQIEELLLQYRPTLLFVEHDRVFRERIATETIEL